ncbi:LysR family transcriptional regulator [Alphaproteobacteria bacterium]|jgi:DNA-binding transcriptional LysR family regulator|nr:LysR family transcriptional regulator [Alphaproteobacteria bacterium]MDA8536677.1 LysR family transcriptional regulator [Alphaproteobacteria bacterium]
MRFMTSLRFIDAVAREKSIRKAAEKLAITSTALNRRILQIEDEIGQPLFERLASGVRLNTAGELFVQHIRTQTAELARVQSQIADLSGIRRGHVRIASGADTMRYFLPETVARYRGEHPAVTFDLVRQSGDAAEQALRTLEADLALIFEPIKSADFQTMATARQQLYCMMSANHPLAKKPMIRLRDCVGQPAILPRADAGLRQLLNVGLIRRSVELGTVIESNSQEFLQNYLTHEMVISFQIPIAMPSDLITAPLNTSAIVARPVDLADVPAGILHIGQLKGRVLPVAAAKFLDSIITELGARYGDDIDQ